MNICCEKCDSAMKPQVQKNLSQIDRIEEGLGEEDDPEIKMSMLLSENESFDKVLDLMKNGAVCKKCRRKILRIYFNGSRVMKEGKA